jgi:hypothetical protein
MLFALLIAAAAAPDAAALARIGITGRTAAPDAAVAQAALNEVGAFASAKQSTMKCGERGGAKASLMPTRWVPADPNFRLGPKGARYERWEVDLCGKSVPFLVVFWKHKGRPDFQVAYPFPAGAAKR